jgi:hypothetical protein
MRWGWLFVELAAIAAGIVAGVAIFHAMAG